VSQTKYCCSQKSNDSPHPKMCWLRHWRRIDCQTRCLDKPRANVPNECKKKENRSNRWQYLDEKTCTQNGKMSSSASWTVSNFAAGTGPWLSIHNVVSELSLGAWSRVGLSVASAVDLRGNCSIKRNTYSHDSCKQDYICIWPKTVKGLLWDLCCFKIETPVLQRKLCTKIKT